MTSWSDKQHAAQQDWLEMQQDALTRPCPEPPIGCGQPIGEPCLNLWTKEPLEKLPCHPSRSRRPTVEAQ